MIPPTVVGETGETVEPNNQLILLMMFKNVLVLNEPTRATQLL